MLGAGRGTGTLARLAAMPPCGGGGGRRGRIHARASSTANTAACSGPSAAATTSATAWYATDARRYALQPRSRIIVLT